MDKNNTTIAPQTNDASSLYDVWKHKGNKEDFFAFMTTPSSERNRFLASVRITGNISGSMIINNVTAE